MGTAKEDIRLRRARQYVEPAGSYAVDDTTNLSTDFLDLAITEGTVQPTRDVVKLNPNTLKQTKDQRDVQIQGIRTPRLNLTGILASFGTVGGVAGLDGTQIAANVPVISGTGTKYPLAQMLAALLGGFASEAGGLGAQTKVQAGTTATVVNVTAGHGVRFTKGKAIGITINGRLEVREVLSRSTDAITVKDAFSTTPSTNAVCYGSCTIYLAEDPQTSLQYVVEGQNTADRYAYLGMQGTLGLNMKAGELPGWTSQLSGANHTKLSTAAMTAATYSLFSPAAAIDAEFRVATVGATTRQVIHAPETSWSPNFEFVDVTSTSPSAVQTRLRKMRIRKDPPASGKFTVYRDASNALDFETIFAADSYASPQQYALFQQIGSAPGSTILISAPTVQFWQPQEKAFNNIAGLEVGWDARTDQAINDPTSEIGNSCLRIHFL